jgi:hypothetical protein
VPNGEGFQIALDTRPTGIAAGNRQRVTHHLAFRPASLLNH